MLLADARGNGNVIIFSSQLYPFCWKSNYCSIKKIIRNYCLKMWQLCSHSKKPNVFCMDSVIYFDQKMYGMTDVEKCIEKMSHHNSLYKIDIETVNMECVRYDIQTYIYIYILVQWLRLHSFWKTICVNLWHIRAHTRIPVLDQWNMRFMNYFLTNVTNDHK